MSYFLGPHVNFYFVIGMKSNFKSSLWVHFFLIIQPYFLIWFFTKTYYSMENLNIDNVIIEYNFTF
jgi:hypothetical protein